MRKLGTFSVGGGLVAALIAGPVSADDQLPNSDTGTVVSQTQLASQAVQSSIIPSGAPAIPADYVGTPAGYYHKSCIHEVPNGAFIDEHDSVIVGGSIVAHYPPCPYSPIRTDGSSRRTHLEGPGYGGWVQDTLQLAPSGQEFSSVKGYITVPPAPANQSGGITIYYFQGLQSSVGSNCGILQPVLQWGVSPAGGGNRWAFASWWWSVNGSNNGFFSSLVSTASGDRLLSYMTITSDDREFDVGMTDQSPGGGATLLRTAAQDQPGCVYNQEFQALEVQNGTGLTSCNQLPSEVDFSTMSFFVSAPRTPGVRTQVSFAPTFQRPIGSNSPNCSNWPFASGADWVNFKP